MTESLGARWRAFVALNTQKIARAFGSRSESDRRRRRRGVIAGVGGMCAFVAATAGFLADVASVQEPVCWVAIVRPVCAWGGFGGVPSAAEEALWAGRGPGDCAGLRAYLSRYPTGAYAVEADRGLAAMERRSETDWSAKELRLPMTVRAGREAAASEDEARRDAERRRRRTPSWPAAAFGRPITG